jgi:hypothetical protein
MAMNIPKKAFVYSVPGTGTRFTNKLLHEVFGYTLIGPRDLLKPEKEGLFYTHLHVHSGIYVRLMERDRGRTIKAVIPLRSPVAQYLTRRTAMNGGTKARNEALQYWKLLWLGLLKQDYVLLPVEDATEIDRKEKVWRVARHLGVVPHSAKLEEFCEKWEKVGTGGPRPEREEYERNGNVEIDGSDLSFLDEDMDRYRDLLGEYRNGAAR